MKIFWSTFFFFLFNFFTSGKACAQDRRPEKLSQRFEKTLRRTATQEPPIKSSLNNFRQLRNLLIVDEETFASKIDGDEIFAVRVSPDCLECRIAIRI